MKPQRKRQPQTPSSAAWSRLRPSYERLIGDQSRDSGYLRDVGLQRNVVDLLGDCREARLLDVGSGTGWLLDSVRVRHGYECDCVPQSASKPGRTFSVEDVRRLSYRDNFFNAVVASLVLMWIEDVDLACRELYRVTARGGRAVIALVHPFSYRTGTVTRGGEFLVRRRYSDSFVLPNLFIADAVGPFRFFHRPLEAYVNAICGAGFILEQMREWSLDMADYRRHVPANAKHPARTDRVPMYAFFRLRKGA